MEGQLERWIEITYEMQATRVLVDLCVVAWDGASRIERDAVPAYRSNERATYTAAWAETRFTKGVFLRAVLDRDSNKDSFAGPRFQPMTLPVVLWRMEDAARDMRLIQDASWRDDTDMKLSYQVFEMVRRLNLAGVIIHHHNRGHETITERAWVVSKTEGVFEGLRQILIERPEDE